MKLLVKFIRGILTTLVAVLFCLGILVLMIAETKIEAILLCGGSWLLSMLLSFLAMSIDYKEK